MRGRSGQAVIKNQVKHSLTHGPCRFHACRNITNFLARHQELVRGARICVLVLGRKKHAVMKSRQTETGLSAEFISDKTGSRSGRSSLTKPTCYAKYRESCPCHTLQERDLSTAPFPGHSSSHSSLASSFKQCHIRRTCLYSTEMNPTTVRLNVHPELELSDECSAGTPGEKPLFCC